MTSTSRPYSSNSPNSPTSSSTCSTFDGGEYFLDGEAKRGEKGMLAMTDDDNNDGIEDSRGRLRREDEGDGSVNVRRMKLEGTAEDGDATPRRRAVRSSDSGDSHRKISGDREDALDPVVGNMGSKSRAKRKRGIRFAPLNVPIQRRLQTLAVLWHATALAVSATVFWSVCAVPLWWPLVVPYLLHLLFSASHHNGASPYIRSPLLRSLPLWSWYNAYFPIHFHRSVPLDPKCNYIFGYSPHGIISFGAWGCFVTDSDSPLASSTPNIFSSLFPPSDVPQEIDTPGGEYGVLKSGFRETRPGYKVARGGGFKKLFPGIKNTLLTLDGNFRIPIYREYLLAMGLASVSRRSCEALLGNVPGADKDKDRGIVGAGNSKRHNIRWDLHYPNIAHRATFSDRILEMPHHQQHSRKPTGLGKRKTATTYLSPFSWFTFFVSILLALLIPTIPPFIREWWLRRRNSGTQLSSPPPIQPSPPQGNSITIVLGGARESLLTQPHTMNIILHRRRGFIKLALNCPNTALVPCLAFGENNVYETLKPDDDERNHSTLTKVQMALKRVLGFTVPVFWARGIFNYDVGLLPWREAVDVVVGRPIFPPVRKEASGSSRTREEEDSLITEMQKLYEGELFRLWEEWKDVFAKERDGELKVVM